MLRMESDTFDLLDLQLLSALEVDGRAPFSRIAAVLGVSDRTIARRYRRLCAEGGLRVVVLRDAARLGEDQWMLRLRCAPDGAAVIAEALARRPDTYWIGLCSGGTEIACITRPRSPGDHDDLLLGKLPRTPSVVEIRAQQLLHRFYGGPVGWLPRFRALDADQIAALRPDLPEPGPARLEPGDAPLLAVLERDGRAGYPELQRATGRSESALRRRLSALIASGAVYVDAEYDTAVLGFPKTAMLWITTSPGALDSVGRTLAGHDEVVFASATAGPSQLVVTVVVRDTAALYAYISGPLGRLEGVRHVEVTPILRGVKQLTYRPAR
ncbi:Lrp/AsnC family transcriptional regulator [Streptomyces rubradiris]|uniref:Transcriptional regulator n=1 Tax=Streptomyces rubradiris TaxID=285531 RepID=A0ABQ3REE1_STRRR|nr:Lrp/AsnC family transcriptional regulator [Streptomyces rubradiris]GHG98514.1 transcriptional regulator [Streptomyces rubradiris]GHI54229.1 transcriptional regulator [Streptomyces rubradiris]